MVKQCVTAVLVATLGLATSASAFDWTNADGDNDFSNLNNWSGSPGSFAGGDFNIQIGGSDYAELSSAIAGTLDDLYVGTADNSTAEFVMSAGADIEMDNRFRVARGANSNTTVTFSGGEMRVPDSYTTLGDNGSATLQFNMTGGTWNCDRQTWAQQAGDTLTLDMSGGTINLDYSDPTPSGVSGGLVLGDGGPTMNISGTAEINARKLYVDNGPGKITMTGGTINITGPDQADPDGILGDVTGDPSLMASEIQFDGGSFNLTGDHEALLDTLISQGDIYTSLAGQFVDAQYSAGSGVTSLALVVPEPASLSLLALGGLLAARRRRH